MEKKRIILIILVVSLLTLVDMLLYNFLRFSAVLVILMVPVLLLIFRKEKEYNARKIWNQFVLGSILTYTLVSILGSILIRMPILVYFLATPFGAIGFLVTRVICGAAIGSILFTIWYIFTNRQKRKQ